LLFNSYEFIFAFLPAVFFIHFYLKKRNLKFLSQCWLFASSLFFYSWWNVIYLPLILASIIVNYFIGTHLNSSFNFPSRKRKAFLISGIVFNLGLLSYFKYANFFIIGINFTTGVGFDFLNLTLPLGISFFTFQQIAFLVDAYKGEAEEYDFLSFAVFVSFFPQLIAGPIVHHKEMMPQFEDPKNSHINYRNIGLGLFIFSIGLFKKSAVADYFALWASPGFDIASKLTFLEGWTTSLSYTFQVYFDFSGYTDMAIGAALLFNIRLPLNFNSPYSALNIRDFWRRWHMTLTRFLRDYIYIPLGGNQKTEFRTCGNLVATFFIGGLWHGGTINFIAWGFLHGVAMLVHRFWDSLNLKMNTFLAWLITFLFVNTTWVFFRAETWSDAVKVLRAMWGWEGVNLTIYDYFPDIGLPLFFCLASVTILSAAVGKNSNYHLDYFQFNKTSLALFTLFFGVGFVNIGSHTEFLYFAF
jgi:D-alanyl-lipoteichoic acid acyltransferase DltB (MBOAT superfamily)